MLLIQYLFMLKMQNMLTLVGIQQLFERITAKRV